MDASRKKPGWAFWTTILIVVVLVVYPLSIAPMSWVCKKLDYPEWLNDFMMAFYAPLRFTLENLPNCFQKSLDQYMEWWFPGSQ